MAERICSMPGCERKHYGHGYCHMHHQRWKRLGTPELPPRRTCSFPGCGAPHKCQGWCGKHYQRWLKYGDPAFVLVDRDATPEERFWRRVDKGDGTGCWLWTGYLDPDGYGMFPLEHRRPVLVHRYAFTLLMGPIPDGLTLDHVRANGCISTACVKAIADEHGPAHLEAVTNHENLLRGNGFVGINARKTHCKRGHPFDDANTHVNRAGSRECLACRRLRRINRGM
jgi:hypothetical protein